MQITRTKKALIAVIALVLIGIFVAVAAVYLPGTESSLPIKDNTVADSGSGADAVSTVSASATAPLQDGKVTDQQTSVPEEWTGVDSTTDWSTVRGQSGNFILMEDITLSSLDTSGGTFSGTFDGNGHTITIDADSSSSTVNVGGLFSQLSGTVKNLRVEVTKFRNFLYSDVGTSCTGMIAGLSSGNATVDNVYIQLLYSPSSISGSDSDEGYIVSQERPKGMYNIMGGVIGKATGTTEIKNTTVDVATTGSYGFVAVARFNKPMLGTNTAYAYVGGFVGEMNGDSLYFEDITLTDTSKDGTGIIQAYSTSTNGRKMDSYVGGIVGYLNEGTFTGIDGLIFNFKAILDNEREDRNIRQTNASSGDFKIGVMFGTYDGNQSPQTFKSIYLINDSVNSYIAGNNETAFTGLIRYADTYTPRFDDDGNIVFYCAKKYAPNSADLLTTFINGSKQVNVMTALMLNDGEDGELTYWLSVPKSGDGSAGSDTSVGFADTKATQSTISTDESAYVSSREYNGELPVGPSANGKAYVCDNASKNVGSYIFKFDKTPYQVIEYGGTEYYVDLNEDGSTGTTVYSPAEGFDPAKEYTVTITPRAITLGNESGNITYGDDLATVQANNKPVATVGSIVENEYVESCVITDYVQFETNAGGEEAFVYTAAVIKDADGNDVTANYNITFAEGKAVVKQKTVAGTLSVENLTYDGSEKVAVFTATEGMGLFNDDVVTITYNDGDRVNVTEAGFTATATVPNNNYTFGGESGNAISQTFYISPKTVEITKNESATTEYDYSGVVPNSVLLTLYNAPQDVEGNNLFLNFAVTLDGQEATVQYAGTYTVTATLAESYINEEGVTVSQANYTATSCEATITIKAKDINVSIDESVANSKDYDGEVVGEDYLLSMFVVDGTVDEGSLAELTLTVTEGEVLNAGTYHLSVSLDPDYGKMYAISSTSVTTAVYTVRKVDVEITKTEYSGQSFNNEEFTDYASLFNAPKGIDGSPLELTYSVTKDGEAATIFNVGTYTVTATLADNGINGNYNAAPFERTYDVEAWEVEIVWSANEYTYTGDVQAVSAKYTDWDSNEIQLAVSFGEGVEFKNAGEYTATASFAEGDNALGNYALPENATNAYKINKADSVINTDGVVKTYTYTGELQTVTGATLNHSEAQLAYSNNTFTTVAEGNGMQVVISVADTANYNGASTSFTITVNKATPAVTANVTIPDGGLFTSSEMPAISADFGENTVVAGTIAWDTDELTADENAYGWTFTPEDTANYNVVTGSETLTVSAVTLESIAIKTQPSKVDYQYGDKFDKTGMVVEAVYNDGARVAVDGYTFTDEYLTTLGENQIEISYNGKTATVAVNVEAKEFEIAYSDLTVVAGTDDFDIESITASIVGTEGNKVTVAGTEYDYAVTVAYTEEGNVYSSDAEVGTTYALTATLAITDLDARNYVDTYTATLKVIATPMTGSWASGTVTADYDGNAHAAVFTADNGLTAGDDFEIQYAVSGTEDWTTTAPVNAGEYVAKVVSLNEGYSADRLTTATVTINKVSVTISASGVENGGYDGTAVAPETLFNVPQGVGDEGALALEYTITKDGAPVDEIKDSGTYKVVANLANADGNYTAAACEVNYTVSPAEVAVNWTGEGSVVYSGDAYEPTFEATGLAGGDQLTVTYQAKDGFALTGDKARNAGSYTATAVLPNANYVFAAETVATFDFTIEKVKVSFSALLDGNTMNVEYGGEYAPSVNDFYSTSVENSEKFESYVRWSLEFDLSGIATANAGTKYEAAVELVVRYVGGDDVVEADYDNFELAGEIADIVVYVEVVAKKINVTATDKSATYDGEKVSKEELCAMFSIYGGPAVSINVNDTSYEYAEITNVGAYNVVVASANGNYEFVGDTDATFTVNAENLTNVSVTGYSGEYDKAAHGAVVSASATTVDSSEVTFTYATSEEGPYGAAPEFTGAGEYTVWYKANAANHNEAAGSFTVTITKAGNEWTVTPSIEGWTYGMTASEPAGEAKFGDVTFTYKTAEGVQLDGKPVNAGSYKLFVSVAESENYARLEETVYFTIKKATYDMVGVTFEDKTVTYNGEVHNITVTGTLPKGVTVSYSEGGKNVGEYDVTATFSGNANYNAIDPMTAKLTISAKAVTVVWSNTELTYSGEAQMPTATADTEITGETLTLTVSGAQTEPGTYTATASTDNGNYTLSNATVQFSIVRTTIVAQFTVDGYGVISVTVEDLGDGVEYSVDGGEWTALPADGKITVTPAASWTVNLRYEGETSTVSHVVYTSADNVVTYLESSLSDNAIDNKAVIDTAKAWLETAIGDKSEATAKIEAAEQAYEAAKNELSESVENAFKATANMTSRAVAATVAIATAVTGLGLAVGAIALRRKGGKKNEK